jgi:hypothetical protein
MSNNIPPIGADPNYDGYFSCAKDVIAVLNLRILRANSGLCLGPDVQEVERLRQLKHEIVVAMDYLPEEVRRELDDTEYM